MSSMLNFISIVSAFIFGVGFVYCIMDATIGKLKVLHSEKEWNGLQYKDFVFLFISATILLCFFDFYKPF